MQSYHTEIEIQQLHPKSEVVCGDVFLSRQYKEEGRTVLVLSDGIGHGIRANVMATLTATMALNYSSFHTKPEIAAQIIMSTLPTEGPRPSYATFTVIEFEKDGLVRIINYDNPPLIILRRNEVFRPSKIYELDVEGEENQGKLLRCMEFFAQKEDRIIFMSDGVTQAGLGMGKLKMGWGHDNVVKYIKQQVANQPDISSIKLAKKIVNQALMHDAYNIKDDTSCGVIYLREPRKMMLITGPPFYKVKDIGFVNKITDFDGVKIICGGTTAEIISRELELKIDIVHEHADSIAPPTWKLKGFDLVTEGILTLGRVEQILDNLDSNTRLDHSPAAQIVKQLQLHDEINIIVGTRINWAHQDPDQPIDIEIRKNVMKRIVKLLEEKFFKKVIVEYV